LLAGLFQTRFPFSRAAHKSGPGNAAGAFQFPKISRRPPQIRSGYKFDKPASGGLFPISTFIFYTRYRLAVEAITDIGYTVPKFLAAAYGFTVVET
jgi:hypothetical protein